MKKIAIIGAGFSGLASAWELLNYRYQVTIFDALPIGSGTSGIAAGLLHPFVGLHSRLNLFGFEGFAASQQLFSVAEQQLGKKIALPTAILRPAYTPEQLDNYQAAAKNYHPHIKWLESKEIVQLIPEITPAPGILIHTAMTVNAPEYISGLWQACRQRGAEFKQHKIEDLDQLHEFDEVVVAMGGHSQSLKETSGLGLRITKGQLLKLHWPTVTPPLQSPLNSQLYCLMCPQRDHLIVGSTFEKEFSSLAPDLDTACQLMLPKLHDMLPHLKDASILDCRAGVRSVTANRLPIVQSIGPRRWLIAGMSSRGLLYHAFYAKKLSQMIYQNNQN